MRVLVVYPAVDGVFQRAVMLLTQFLRSRGGVTVVIDVWERGSLAEQGPLRWLHTQADLADRVLIILPPQRTQTGNKLCCFPVSTNVFGSDFVVNVLFILWITQNAFHEHNAPSMSQNAFHPVNISIEYAFHDVPNHKMKCAKTFCGQNAL